jgi:hypothetical protein
MRRSISPRRALALSASVGLATALAWLPAGPASAAVSATFGVVGQATTNAGTCTLTSSAGSDSPVSGISNFSSGTKSHSVSLDASFVASGDPTDTVNMIGNYSSSMSIVKNGGNLASMTMNGAGSVSVEAAKGSATTCAPEALVAGETTPFTFTETSPGWFYVARHTVPKNGLAAVVVQDAGGNAVLLDIVQGNASDGVLRGFARPGSFSSVALVGLAAGNVPPIIFKGTPKSSVALTFHRAGSALAATKGTGKRYVEFPGAVSCGAHTATLRWTSSANKVDSGAFFVNGAKKASDNTPRGGDKIVLKHLSSTADIKITAKLALKAGGSATASRSYVPCKG